MALIFSELTPEEQVAAIFVGYYDRAPAVPGLNQYVADFAAGQTPADVARSFVMQQETLDLYPSLAEETISQADAEQLVTDIFNNLFNRNPVGIEDGTNPWVQELLSGSTEVGQVILNIMSGAQGGDLVILQNKIDVATAYVEAAIEVGDDGTGALKGTILDDVDGTQDSVVAAVTAITEAFPNVVPGNENIFLTGPSSQENGIDVTGVGGILPTAGNDTFNAEDGTLNSADRLDGGAGRDTLSVFNETGGVAVSPTTKSIETVVYTNQTNDLFSTADNNVGGYTNGNTIEVDVEMDAGRMVGVDRWENFDSRADLVIEDARDDDDTNGTYTADITVAMVSTDPGNVDYAVYFDGPVNQSTDNGVITLQILDQENADTIAGSGTSPVNNASVLEENFYSGASFVLSDGTNNIDYQIDIAPEDLEAANASYAAYAAALQAVADANNVPVTISLGNEFTISDATGVFKTGIEIVIETNEGFTVVDDSVGFVVAEGAEQGGSDIYFNPASSNQQSTDLITLNVELDDVGKGSTGGDAMFGAMSTGRQVFDDGTSDSPGIQQFDIEVDRSSKLQTINSTNNALEVVNIVNGENDGPNNTTTAADEMIGNLVVRGVANPQLTVATNNPMPGAVPQHNTFGFSDVRVINAAAMIGSVDLTAELTSEVVEKYLKVEDTEQDGNADDRTFDYDLGANNDAFLIKIDDDFIGLAGTGGREDFVMDVDGNDGNDVITTVIGNATKLIDGQGRDFYDLDTGSTAWYANHAADDGSTFSVDGGAGDDAIWTYGAGNFAIADGAGSDVIYTDNSGVLDIDQAAALVGLTPSGVNALASAFQGDENNQIDHFVGALWSFNDTGVTNGFFGDNQGANNEAIVAATADTAKVATSQYVTELTVSFFGAQGSLNANTAYTATVQIEDAQIAANGTVTDQVINQAIKRAINDDPVLNDMLEAVDAAGQSLFVYSKIDGGFNPADLAISLTEKVTTAGATTETDLSGDANFASAYTTGGAETDFATLGASGVESDNLITMSPDGANDTVVLGTGLASNDTLIYGNGQFGTDTVMNFVVGDSAADFPATGVPGGGDAFDFTTISYVQAAANFSQGAANQLDNSVSILAEANTGVAAGAIGNNDTAAKVADLYNGAADADATVTTTDHIVIVYDDNANGLATQSSATLIDDFLIDSENNTGTVYLVTDTDGADATAVELGDINLIGTDWSTLTFDNFA